MRTRNLGATGLVVSEIGFGCFGIGGNASGNSYGPTVPGESTAAVLRALDLGCTLFDAADVYGLGESERVLGQCLSSASKSGLVIATKGGAVIEGGAVTADFSARHLRRAVIASLRRLRRDSVEVYQLHDAPLPVLEQGEVFAVLEGLERDGLVRCSGASVHTPEEAFACLRYPVVRVLQIPLNLLARALGGQDWGPVLEEAQRRGVGVIARQALASGFLSGRHTLATAYGAGDIRGAWSSRRRGALIALAESLQALVPPEVTLSQIALRYVLDLPGVSSVIVGMKSAEQVEENLRASDLPPLALIAPATGERG